MVFMRSGAHQAAAQRRKQRLRGMAWGQCSVGHLPCHPSSRQPTRGNPAAAASVQVLYW